MTETTMAPEKPGAVDGEKTEPGGIWHWLKALPARYGLLVAASAAVTAFLPQAVIPEPLDALRVFGTVIIVIGFLLTWAARTWIRKHLRRVIGATAGMLVTLVLVHQLFVKAVRYRTETAAGTTVENVWVITGWRVADPELADMTAEDRVRTVGYRWDELRAVWGGSFVFMAIAYSLLYLMVVNGLILSLGGTDFAQPRPRARRKSASEAAG
jgi:uncharacterized protein YjeT (DUF2065 family)